VGLLELFVAGVLVGLSAVNGAVPAVAWSRSRDARFLLLSGANLVLAAVGAVWVWGALPPLSPPGWAGASLPILGMVLLVALLLLATTIWPRRS